MAKAMARTLARRVELGPQAKDDVKYAIEARINGGMITAIDASDLPPNALQDAKNVYVRLDKTGTIEGNYLLTPTKPNSNAVLTVYSYKNNAGNQYTLRFTKSSIHKRGAGSWSNISISPALTGTDTNLFSIATAFNQVFFANGVDDIMQIDAAGVGSAIELGPKYKYITSFYNRIIGANFVASGAEDPTQVGWSGDASPADTSPLGEWDALLDFSAGVTPLISSPGDTADFLTGIFGFTDVMVILREKSVWLATKQPIATNPFNFQAVVPGKGCTAPYSAAVIPGGLMWADPRTRKIYAYVAGGQPESIGEQIEDQVFPAITNAELVQGSYNAKQAEYSLLVPTSSNYSRVWTFNFRTKAWSYQELPNISCIGDVDSIAQEITIDDLVGDINSLTGTIDSLSGSSSETTQRIYGRTDGDIYVTSDNLTGLPTEALTATIISKNFYLPVETLGIQKLKFEILVQATSTIVLSYSKDHGKTWETAKTFTLLPDPEAQILTYHKYIRARKFTWKLECSMQNGNGKWELIDYEVHFVPSGKTVRDF